jgi:hypothetical protein
MINIKTTAAKQLIYLIKKTSRFIGSFSGTIGCPKFSKE